jgi:DNA-binding transcriptional regulator YhcF (GntR family)
MRWVFENGLPIYQQMITSLKEMIANGTYPPGSRMPSVRELAMEAGVNPNTVQRAFAELERDGLLHTERTNGRKVSEDRKVLDHLKVSLAEEAVDDMVRRLKKLGMSGREIADLAAERAEHEEAPFDPEDADTERE